MNPTLVYADSTKMTASGVIATGAGYLFGLLIGTDSVNDPTFTIYDNTSASGKEIVPTMTIDASALGINGFFPPTALRFTNGLYLSISGGTNEVTVFYRLKEDVIDGAVR